MLGLEPSLALFLAILAAAFVLLSTERLRNDVVAILLAVALATTGLLKPHDALAGFGSEPAIVLARIFVLSAELHRTGVSDLLSGAIGRLAGGGYAGTIAVLMSAVELLSAVTHHVTMTAVMLPTMLEIARQRRMPGPSCCSRGHSWPRWARRSPSSARRRS